MTSPRTEIRDLVSPGEILQEMLEERGMTGAELARRTGLSEKYVDQLLIAEVALLTETAAALEKALGVPAQLWTNAELNYRAEHDQP